MAKDLNDYIKRSHIAALEKFKAELDGIMDTVKFWRKCLRRAQRYWSMDSEELDKIQDGEIEDTNDEED